MIVVGAHNGGTTHRVDEEWSVSSLLFVDDHLFKDFSIHSTSPSIAWDLSHIVHSHSCDHSTSVDTIMRLGWSESDWLLVSSPSLSSNVREELLSCAHQGHNVSHRASWV